MLKTPFKFTGLLVRLYRILLLFLIETAFSKCICGPRISCSMRFPLDGKLNFYLKNCDFIG